MATILDYLASMEYLPSREGKQIYASNSEKRRWIQNGSVEINGVKVKDIEVSAPKWEDRVVLHPKGKSRTSL